MGGSKTAAPTLEFSMAPIAIPEASVAHRRPWLTPCIPRAAASSAYAITGPST